MLGLIVLFAFGLYFVAAFFVVRATVLAAKARGKRYWLWGGLAAFAMYNLVFGDWIPTIAARQYYCAKESGFWVYKSVVQWKAENPRALETLVAFEGAPNQSQAIPGRDGRIATYFLNQRFNWVTKDEKFNSLLNLYKTEWQLVDIENNEVLARFQDFSTAQMHGGGGWNGWKFWLYSSGCPNGPKDEDKFRTFRNNFMGNKN